MSIEVEAVEEVPVDAPEYVLYGGKGGVGKTTMAAATALASAANGHDTLVVSTDPAHSLSDTLKREVSPEPSRVHDEYPLYGAEIDPDAAMADAALFDEEGDMGGMLGGLGELLGAPGEEGGIGGAMPGADEAAAMQQLLVYLDDERFERVVVDTAPTGHTLRLLELPDVMDSMVGRLLSLRERLSGMVEGLSGLFGEEEEPAGEMEDLQALRERIERLRTTLRDPTRTDFRIVIVPEEMSVAESERLRSRLEGFDIPVGTVVVNRVMEPLADVIEGSSVAGDAGDAGSVGAGVVSPDLDACEFCQRRWQVQQDALTEAQDLFRDHDVRRVPLLAEEVRGEAMLRVVAACLS